MLRPHLGCLLFCKSLCCRHKFLLTLHKSGGFCGNGPSYCGTGCLSGCDGNEVVAFGSNNSVSGDIVYIDQSIWTKDLATIACEPPCVLVLPPWSLSPAETISASLLTTSWFVTETITRVTTQGGAAITAVSVTQVPTSTVLSESAITLSSIDFSPIYIQSGQTGSTTFTPEPSITIAPIVVTYDVPSITVPTSFTSSSSEIPPVFRGTASGDKRTRTFFPPHIHTPIPPKLPKLPWHRAPPLPPRCLVFCGPPPGGHSNNNNDQGGCQGADCGSQDCEGSGCNSDTTGSCHGANCPGGQNQGSNQQDNQEPDNNDEEENQACLAAPIIQEQPAGNGKGNGNGGGGAGGGSSPNPSPSLSLSTLSARPKTLTSVTFTTTTLPSPPPAPKSTVTIITVVPAPVPSTTTRPPPPEATCTAVGEIENVDIGIWTNYITDNGAALQNQANKKCLGAHLSKWSVQDSSKSYTAADGTVWVSNQLYQFTLVVTHPQQILCLREAIVAAGGPNNTPECDFAPLLNQPKRRGR